MLKEFAKEWNFEIVTRSPNYPRSNGLAEKGVAIAKNLLKKSIEENKDIYAALLDYRNSPLKHMNYTPSQLLMSRMCKTKLPISADLLKPTLCENVNERFKLKQEYHKKGYNKAAKDLQPFEPNTDVTVYNHVSNCWEPGIVTSKHDSPRSYIVQDSNGTMVRRNRIDLRESCNKYECINNMDPDLNMTEPYCQTQVNDHSSDLVGLENVNVEQNSTNDVPAPGSNVQSYITRSGRHVKKPKKLTE